MRFIITGGLMVVKAHIVDTNPFSKRPPPASTAWLPNRNSIGILSGSSRQVICVTTVLSAYHGVIKKFSMCTTTTRRTKQHERFQGIPCTFAVQLLFLWTENVPAEWNKSYYFLMYFKWFIPCNNVILINNSEMLRITNNKES